MRSNISKPDTKLNEKVDKSTNNSNQKATTTMTNKEPTNGTTISGGSNPEIDWDHEERVFVKITQKFNLQHEFDKTNLGEMTRDIFETSEPVQAFIRRGQINLYQLEQITDCSSSEVLDLETYTVLSCMIWRFSVLNKIFLGNMKHKFNPQIPELINSKFTIYSKERTYIKTSDFWHQWHTEHSLPDNHLTDLMSVYIDGYVSPSQKIEEVLFSQLYHNCSGELLYQCRNIIQNREAKRNDSLGSDQTTVTVTATTATAAVPSTTATTTKVLTTTCATLLYDTVIPDIQQPSTLRDPGQMDMTATVETEVPKVAVVPGRPLSPLAACWSPLNPLAACWLPQSNPPTTSTPQFSHLTRLPYLGQKSLVTRRSENWLPPYLRAYLQQHTQGKLTLRGSYGGNSGESLFEYITRKKHLPMVPITTPPLYQHISETNSTSRISVRELLPIFTEIERDTK